jgi:hypothetical protein
MSTKTTFKRIALVAVAALGLGTLSTVPAANAATVYNATYTAPTTVDLQAGTVGSVAGVTPAFYVGLVQIDLSSVDSALSTSADSASVTIEPFASGTAKDVTFANALTMSLTQQATTAVTVAVGTASTGYNALNNSAATLGGTTRQLSILPVAAAGLASGRAYLNLDRSALAATDTGAKVKYTLTVAAAGVVRTLVSSLTLTIGTKAGTATTPVTTGTVAAGGTVTATYTQPYTNVAAGATVSPAAFAITDTIANGDPTFSVTAVVTGGSATFVRTNATTLTPTLLKNALTGDMSVTYTMSVTVPATAVAGETVSLYSYVWTVQPYTPAYNSSTVSIAASTHGYRVATTAGGDGILWAAASNVTNAVATVTVAQFDQNGAAITAPAFARSVSATITGKGSLAALTGADVVVKSQTKSVANTGLTGSDTFDVFSDGTSGEGTLTISVGDAAVQTYKVRFYGDAESITATLIRPIGSTSAATNGVDGSPATTRTNTLVTTKDVTATSAPAIAVSVKDANGWTIPTAAPTVTSSNRAVVASGTRLFIDSGVSVPASEAYSAGTFVQHFSYTTVANASGSTSDLTFSVVNAAGTALTTTPVKVTTGGALSTGKIAFDKATYQPGEIVTLTATGLDSAGNKAVDGSDLRSSFTSSGAITWTTSLALVDGTRTRTFYAPMATGTWTLTVYDAADRTYVATATVVNAAAEAKAASDAATEAATAAGDAAAEATDAANAATDAANAAAEAADAATAAAQDAADAVAALATSVSEMVNALKKQITSLTNLVIKIQKKVRA